MTGASASHDVQPARIDGETRTDTAAQIAELQYPDGTDRALLARDDDFPDALASAALAREYGAPILLTSTDQLSERTDTALETLGVQSVSILGGDGAISEDVEEELEQQGYGTARIFGADRYETAAEITRLVQEANDNAGNFPGGVRAAFLATGEDFKDALTVGPLAANPGAPIPTLLTAGSELPDTTAQMLEQLNIEQVFVVGGPLAVSPDVVAEVDDDDTSVQRISGPDAAWTAAEVANFAGYFLEFTASEIVVARSDTWPDALGAGPFAGADANPILLSGTPGNDDIPSASEDWTEDACGDVGTVRAVGGTGAVTTAQLENFETTAENCHDSEDGDQTYIVSPQQALELAAGESATFTVGARYDQQQLADDLALDVALFPCGDVSSVEGPGHPQYADRNTDNLADGIASTDTGAAAITAVEGAALDQAETHVRDVEDTDGDGDISATVESAAADCTVVTFFVDENNNSAFDLDPSDDADEAYGVGKVTWS